jgi:CBS domain containing-hemolysin-like protein
MDILIKLLVVLALVITNGFFVATEFALVSVRRSRIESLVDEGVARARPVLSALHDLDGFVAATQLGITIASIGLGWVGEPAIAAFLDPALEAILPPSWADASAHTISFIIAFRSSPSFTSSSVNSRRNRWRCNIQSGRPSWSRRRCAFS